MEDNVKTVNIIVDDVPYSVPAGLNLIQALATLGIEIPHFCYSPCLSNVGSCRMCQVELVGSPKLVLACQTKVAEGQVIRTQRSSEKVRLAQQAVLEFLLINHPLDCPICDQAGRCKLQDYYMRYSQKASRFLEEKEKGQKKVELGKQIIFDSERCIKCTRCVRFCNEITETHELAVSDRGLKSAIIYDQAQALKNPFSGCLAELCPVGAMTDRKWRFKSRAWFTQNAQTVCLGCSRLCACKVATRDKQVVQVVGHNTLLKNEVFLCDAGRYGFGRFIPQKRLAGLILNGQETSLAEALNAFKTLGQKPLLVLFSPDLMFEEYQAWKAYLESNVKVYNAVVAISKAVEKATTTGVGKLQDYIFNDNAGNLYSAIEAGLVPADLKTISEKYYSALDKLEGGVYQQVLFVGDNALSSKIIDDGILEALKKIEFSVAIMANAQALIVPYLKLIIAGQTFYEKSGTVINHFAQKQFIKATFSTPNFPTYSDLDFLQALGK